MKSKYLTLEISAILIIGVILISGCTKQETPTKSSGSTNCGTNMDCLITASQDCNPAKVTYEETFDIFGVLITTTTFYEIKGTEANKCILYLRTENQNIDFSDGLVQQMLAEGATQEQIQQQKQGANKQAELVESKDGTCKFNNNADLTSLLNKWDEGTISGSVSCSLVGEEWQCTHTGDWAVADCEGERFITQVSQ